MIHNRLGCSYWCTLSCPAIVVQGWWPLGRSIANDEGKCIRGCFSYFSGKRGTQANAPEEKSAPGISHHHEATSHHSMPVNGKELRAAPCFNRALPFAIEKYKEAYCCTSNLWFKTLGGWLQLYWGRVREPVPGFRPGSPQHWAKLVTVRRLQSFRKICPYCLSAMKVCRRLRCSLCWSCEKASSQGAWRSQPSRLLSEAHSCHIPERQNTAGTFPTWGCCFEPWRWKSVFLKTF